MLTAANFLLLKKEACELAQNPVNWSAKEFIQLLRDRRNRLVLFVAPLIQMLVFGYVVNYDIRHIRLAVVDYSQTRESRELGDAFTGSRLFFVTHTLSDEKGLTDLLLRGRVDMGLGIAPDFAARLRSGKTAAVQILADGSMSNMAALRVAYAASVLDRYNSDKLRELQARQISYGRIDARIRTWYNPNIESQYFFVPGIVAFVIMLISLLLTSSANIRRGSGTLEHAHVPPCGLRAATSEKPFPIPSIT